MPSNDTNKKSRSVSVRLPLDIYEKAVAKADLDNRTLSNYILHLLTMAISDDCSCVGEGELLSKLKKLIVESEGNDARVNEPGAECDPRGKTV